MSLIHHSCLRAEPSWEKPGVRGKRKPGAGKDPEVSGVWEPGEVGTAPSPRRFQLLLEALWDAESVRKARQVRGREENGN